MGETINQQVEDTSPTSDDYLLVWDSTTGTTKKVTVSNLATNLPTSTVKSEALKLTVAARAYRANAQTIEVGTEVIIFDTENYDIGSDYNTGTGQFIAPVTGYYQVNASAQLPNVNAADDQMLLHIYVNGSLYATGNNLYAVAIGDDPRCHVSDLVAATAGQAIEIRIQNASSATESLGLGTSISYMSVYLVGQP